MAPLKITRFEPHTLFDDGNRIFVLIAFEAMAFGRHYSFPNNGHLWQFNPAGKVIKHDHVTDTAQMIGMARGRMINPCSKRDHSFKRTTATGCGNIMR